MNKYAGNKSVSHHKNRMLLASTMVLLPSILFLIFWAHEKHTKDKWEFSLFLEGIILIILGCLETFVYEISFSKSNKANIIGALLFGIGGISYLIAAIGIAVNLSDHVDDIGIADVSLMKPINTKDSVLWFGLYSLVGLDAVLLAMDCLVDLTARSATVSLWASSLAISTGFAFSIFVSYDHDNLTWWEVTGTAGFGTMAITTAFLGYMSHKIRPFLTICAFLGSIAVWIYYCALLEHHNFNGYTACLLIGIPFLITAQTLYLLYECSLYKN